ncbi:MAG: pilus assembly protein TadG-related protein [Bryobacteraceae bacterium]
MRLRASGEGGTASFQLVVLLVPVMFGLMGFAVDLGRMYSARNDLKNAANSIAQAAAAQLAGTSVSIENSTTAGMYAISTANGRGNLYDFGGLPVGEASGNLNSEQPTLNFYDTVAAAIGSEGASGGEAGATTARHVKVTVRGEAPLVFWRFLSLAQDGKLNLAAQAVAGVSSPVCQACGIEPIGLQAISQEDTTDFGFAIGSRYTLGYVCNGGPTPGPIANTVQRVPYVLLNKYNEAAQALAEENTQLYRIGSLGLPANTDSTFSCIRYNAEETIWINAAPLNCNQNLVNPQVTAFMCGLAARFDSVTVPAACNTVAETDTILGASTADTDIADVEDYTAYVGNRRRVITVPIVDTASTATMIVLGFRQFLLEPNANDVTINAADQNGRVAALYLGTVMPVRAGRIDGCSLTTGPGKVVLHQ